MRPRSITDMGRPKGSKNVTEQKKFPAVSLQRVNVVHTTVGNQLNMPRSTITNVILRQASSTEVSLSNRGRTVNSSLDADLDYYEWEKKTRFKPTHVLASMFCTASGERLWIKNIRLVCHANDIRNYHAVSKPYITKWIYCIQTELGCDKTKLDGNWMGECNV